MDLSGYPDIREHP